MPYGIPVSLKPPPPPFDIRDHIRFPVKGIEDCSNSCMIQDSDHDDIFLLYNDPDGDSQPGIDCNKSELKRCAKWIADAMNEKATRERPA